MSNTIAAALKAMQAPATKSAPTPTKAKVQKVIAVLDSARTQAKVKARARQARTNAAHEADRKETIALRMATIATHDEEIRRAKRRK